MEHFIRIAFWIVTLSGCLPANSLPIFDIHDSNIDSMKTNVICPSDSKFYTPSNVKKQCMTAALDCFLTELKGTVKKKCNDSDDSISQACEFLERVIKQSGNATSDVLKTECACKSWSTTNFSNFLDQMESAIQRHHSAGVK